MSLCSHQVHLAVKKEPFPHRLLKSSPKQRPSPEVAAPRERVTRVRVTRLEQRQKRSLLASSQRLPGCLHFVPRVEWRLCSCSPVGEVLFASDESTATRLQVPW